MLIHKDQAELQTLVTALQTLPIEGKDLAEIVYREWTRQESLKAIKANVQSTTSTIIHNAYATNVPTTIRINVPTHPTDYPTTLIDDYWGLRLGLIRG